MKRIWSGIAAVLLVSTPVLAQEPYQQPVDAQEPYQQPVDVAAASGWYLRGDAGFSQKNLRGAHYFQGSNSNLEDFDSAEVDNSYLLGVGVGYQINQYLRTDVTLDYLGKSDFHGSTSGSCGVAVSCVSTDVSSMSAWSLMANAYVDFWSYGSFTAYAGGGLGGTKVNWRNLRNTSCDTTDPTNCDPTVEHDGEDPWRFTYALMLGASIDLTCALKADVGYRYRRVEGGDMFGFASNGGPGYDKGFDLHEGRAGLRYAFGENCDPVYDPPAEPIVYK
ncbi:outer membrane protein [Pararhizobium sp. A13]|uniref:outer membrane protein n=1 Tax=Pararhizobium sp. A13 TaxID=3133975 RepID=UPI003247BA8B